MPFYWEVNVQFTIVFYLTLKYMPMVSRYLIDHPLISQDESPIDLLHNRCIIKTPL